MRKIFLSGIAGALMVTSAFAMGDRFWNLTDEEKAQKIHDQVITIDTHVDIPLTFATTEVDPGVRGNQQNDLVKMNEGGMDAAFFIVYVGQGKRDEAGYEDARKQAMTKFSAIRRMTMDMYPERIELALSADDVRRIHASGKKVALIGIENGYVMAKDLSRLQEYYDLGARYMSLTHNGHNDLGDSSAAFAHLGDKDEEHGGLSDLGRAVVDEMNRLGIMVDVAHAGRKTVFEIAERSKAPIISSHHALRHFVDIPRNLSDEELVAIQKNGGVVQIVAFDSYNKPVPEEKRAARKALSEKWGIRSFADFQALTDAQEAAYMVERAALDETWPPANVADFVDHIDHAVQVMGIDHVGISSDFEGGGGVVGWKDASETLNITIELVRRGYSKKDIEKIWGGNLLRVMEEVEEVAAKLQSE